MRPARLAALAGCLGLLALWPAWARTPAAAALAALPLLPFLPALLRDRRGGFLGLGLVSLLYFMHGVGAATNPAERAPALLEVALSLCLFGGSLARLKS